MRNFPAAATIAATAAALALPAAASGASATHCSIPTAMTPKVCVTASTGHNVSVVASGAWVTGHPDVTPTGRITMGGAKIDVTFAKTTAGTWGSDFKLPAGRLWTLKVTVLNGSTPKVVTVMTFVP